MEIRILEYFLAIAEEENITKAAALLHVSQPTLSRAMMQLEKELQVTLFTRSSHSIALTDSGRLLKRRAQEILELEKKAKQELSSQEEISGKLSIGSGEYLHSNLLAKILARFQEEHPRVQIELYSGNSKNILERIEQGTLDIGFLLEPVNVDKYEVLRCPFLEEWGILVSEKSDLAMLEKIRPADLAGRKVIMTERPEVVREINRWFAGRENELEVTGSGNLSYNLICLARENGAAFLNLKRDASYPGVVYLPFDPPLYSGTLFAWKNTQINSALTKAFIKHLKKCILAITGNEK